MLSRSNMADPSSSRHSRSPQDERNRYKDLSFFLHQAHVILK